jgi:hypothetical protein
MTIEKTFARKRITLSIADFQHSRKPRKICPRCASQDIIFGAGKKPGQESQHCGNCQRFLGYSAVASLKKSRKRKELTKCLEVLENQGIQGELALFALSLAAEGGEG